MPKPKIAMIGAGRVVFTLNLSGDIFTLCTYLCDSLSRHTDIYIILSEFHPQEFQLEPC